MCVVCFLITCTIRSQFHFEKVFHQKRLSHASCSFCLEERMTFVYDDNHSEELECAVCLSPFEKPVEIVPCNHVFCRDCINGLDSCPECRVSIQGREHPNRVIVNMVLQLKGRCTVCEWTGSRETFESTHRGRCPGSPPAKLSPMPPPDVEPPMQRQRSSATSAYFSDPFGGEPIWTEYGLDQLEYDEIVAAFAQRDESGEGLTSSQIAPVARWLNAPNTADDMAELFDMFSVGDGAKITLHQFCVWFSGKRRKPEAEYGLTNQQYISVLSLFHSFFPTAANTELVLNASRVGEIANLVLERSVPASEIRGFMGDKPGMTLHELLVNLKSALDGWEVCAVPDDAAPSATAAQAASAVQPTRSRARTMFDKLFHRNKETPAATPVTTTAHRPASSSVVSRPTPTATPVATRATVPPSTAASVPAQRSLPMSPSPQRPSPPQHVYPAQHAPRGYPSAPVHAYPPQPVYQPQQQYPQYYQPQPQQHYQQYPQQYPPQPNYPAQNPYPGAYGTQPGARNRVVYTTRSGTGPRRGQMYTRQDNCAQQ